MMVRWICGVGLSLKNRISSDKLYKGKKVKALYSS